MARAMRPLPSSKGCIVTNQRWATEALTTQSFSFAPLNQWRNAPSPAANTWRPEPRSESAAARAARRRPASGLHHRHARRQPSSYRCVLSETAMRATREAGGLEGPRNPSGLVGTGFQPMHERSKSRLASSPELRVSSLLCRTWVRCNHPPAIPSANLKASSRQEVRGLRRATPLSRGFCNLVSRESCTTHWEWNWGFHRPFLRPMTSP
jgi:hypothetical protein